MVKLLFHFFTEPIPDFQREEFQREIWYFEVGWTLHHECGPIAPWYSLIKGVSLGSGRSSLIWLQQIVFLIAVLERCSSCLSTPLTPLLTA